MPAELEKMRKAILNFYYSIPIEESGIIDSDFIIAGTAINATTTSNNHKFLPEVLQESAKTLIGVPLLVDHENKVENIKGRVFYAGYDEINQRIPFKAKVMDNTIKSMIKDGRLNSVSVGATVDPKNIEEDKDGTLIPRNIQFKELSLVAVPADQGATFGIALKEAYKSFKEADEEEDEVDMEEPGEDTENAEKAKNHIQETDNHINERRENMSETEAVKETVEVKEAKTEISELDRIREENEKLKIELAKKENADLKEKLKRPEEKKVEAKTEKEEIEEEEILPGYKILEGVGSLRGGSFTMIRNKY
jgi:phage head maturation protease